MLLVVLLYFAGTTAFTNDDCDYVLRVKNREVVTILSPNFPQKEPTGSACRWTVFADLDKRIILECPFYNKPEDKQCRGKFRISPELGEDTLHCSDKGFSRIGVNHRMVITYENNVNEPADAFTCYLHAELHSRWKLIENEAEFQRQIQHDFHIKLGINDVTQLVAPNSSDPDGWMKIQWTVTAPPDSRMILSCPFTNRPPHPLTRQLVPCRGHFTVKIESDTPKEYHCSQQTIQFSTTDKEMIVLYNNKFGPPIDDFLCYVYSEPLTPTKPELFASPFKDCDFVIQIHENKFGTIHWHDKMDHAYCRWTLVASMDSQMKIEAVEPHVTKKTDECGGVFMFQVAGRNSTEYCLGIGFLRVTPTNWVVLINKSFFGKTPPSFRFSLRDVPKKLINESYYFGATGGFENSLDDHVMLLSLRETRRWAPPFYFDVGYRENYTSRVTVVAPRDCRVVLTCHYPIKAGTGIPNEFSCDPDITVVTEERNNILQHCSARPFAKSSPNNRMVVVFGKPNPLARKSFSCQLYAEEKLPWIRRRGIYLRAHLNPSCHYDIHLPKNGMQVLASPNLQMGLEPGRSTCTWDIFSTQGTRIILSCPHGNPPPKMQFKEPCSAYLIVSTKNRPNSTYCIDSPFLRTSENENMTVSYSNYLPTPSPAMHCFLHSELILPQDECTICNGTRVSPYETCDYIYNLTYHEMRELDFPQHEKPPGTFCRWTLVSPPDSRILLSCPYNTAVTEHSCNSHFTVHNGGKETRYCSGQNLHEISTYNWTILTYDNPSFDYFPPITCFAYVEKKISTDTCVNCTASASLALLDYSQCDITIKIEIGDEEKYLETPHFPQDLQPGVPCRWTVKSSAPSSISMKCENHGPDDEAQINENQRCRGLIVIYGAGPDADFQCRHGSFGTRSRENKLIVTYGNQFGLTKKGFRCSIAAEDSSCYHKVYLGRPLYNQYFILSTPYWMGEVSPFPFCFWSIQSKGSTQLYFRCGLSEKKERVQVSMSGDDNFSDSDFVPVTSRKVRVSVENKMHVRFQITNTTKPNQDIGCMIFVERNPLLGPECTCGNKFNSMESIYLNNRRNFRKEQIWRQEYTMMAGIYNYDLESEIFLSCAATIISEYYALTSANCIEKSSGKQLGLAVGIRSNVGELPLIDINYTKVHENRTESLGIWDIGIVGVETPIIFNYMVQPVCLTFHQGDKAYANEYIISLGWGDIQITDPLSYALPHPLLVADGSVEPDENCTSLGRFTPTTHLCLIYRKRLDMCQEGFEGGPILWEDPVTGLLKLIGVSITHDDCEPSASSAIAMNMSEHLSWVEETLRDKATFCKEE